MNRDLKTRFKSGNTVIFSILPSFCPITSVENTGHALLWTKNDSSNNGSMSFAFFTWIFWLLTLKCWTFFDWMWPEECNYRNAFFFHFFLKKYLTNSYQIMLYLKYVIMWQLLLSVSLFVLT